MGAGCGGNQKTLKKRRICFFSSGRPVTRAAGEPSERREGSATGWDLPCEKIMPLEEAPKSWAGPLSVLAVHLLLTAGILLGGRHDAPSDAAASVVGAGPNYASFAPSAGGESIAVSVGGRKWYG